MPVDMSAHAVTTRLKRVSQLRRLCVSLSKAKIIDQKPRQNKFDDKNTSLPDPVKPSQR